MKGNEEDRVVRGVEEMEDAVDVDIDEMVEVLRMDGERRGDEGFLTVSKPTECRWTGECER